MFTLKNLIIGIILTLTVCSVTFAQSLTQEQIEEAVGLIRCKSVELDRFGQQIIYSNAGSGGVIGETELYYYFITNAHVAGSAVSYRIDFFRKGALWKSVVAEFFWKKWNVDIACDICVLSIDKAQFTNTEKLRVIPVAPDGTPTPPGTKIYGSGFPFAGDLDYWEGEIIKDAPWLRFVPRPDSGQSGTIILTDLVDANGEVRSVVIALVTLQSDNIKGGHGSASSMKTFRKQFKLELLNK